MTENELILFDKIVELQHQLTILAVGSSSPEVFTQPFFNTGSIDIFPTFMCSSPMECTIQVLGEHAYNSYTTVPFRAGYFGNTVHIDLDVNCSGIVNVIPNNFGANSTNLQMPVFDPQGLFHDEVEIPIEQIPSVDDIIDETLNRLEDADTETRRRMKEVIRSIINFEYGYDNDAVEVSDDAKTSWDRAMGIVK